MKFEKLSQIKKPILCSACLMGIACRYDGRAKPNEKILKLSKRKILIPVCPEILGGLPTPRERAEIKGKRVVTQSGKDITKQFLKGAKEVLKIAKIFRTKLAIFADKSPSCGVHYIYDGTFSKKLIKGEGVCTKLLRQHQIKVICPDEIE